MLVKELIDNCNFTLLCGDGEKEIKSFYCCDLLSNALIKLKEGAVWLTVMNNINVSAVAYNNDVACVVLTEGNTPDGEMLQAAVKHGVTVLGSKLDSYKTIIALQEANATLQIN